MSLPLVFTRSTLTPNLAWKAIAAFMTPNVLTPIESVWQLMRGNWLSNRTFKSSEDTVAVCRETWTKLFNQPWKIISIGMWGCAQGLCSTQGCKKI